MKNYKISDPFKEARQEKGLAKMEDQGEDVTMVLGHKDLRRCAHNWKSFQSGAAPGRIVIPSEENIRDTRQIPFEVDPPLHGGFRAILDPWFRRPLEEEYTAKLEKQIESIFEESLQKDSFDVVSEFALQLQSRALTLLLNTPYSQAETWISWGTHVFRSETNALDGDKAKILYDYIDKEIERAIENPTNDLYSVLLASEANGKKLTKEEVKGIIILTFAGGRDTVINAVTNSIAYFAEHPESIDRLRKDPEILNFAIEELIRYFSPLTHMGRITTENTEVCEHALKADSKISLNWASANRDERVFENANDVIIDRKINPHVAFGFGTHNCLGATHARQILKVLIKTLINKIKTIEILDAKENIETIGDYKRKVGFESLQVKFN